MPSTWLSKDAKYNESNSSKKIAKPMSQRDITGNK